jgi:hypothetical protein
MTVGACRGLGSTQRSGCLSEEVGHPVAVARCRGDVDLVGQGIDEVADGSALCSVRDGQHAVSEGGGKSSTLGDPRHDCQQSRCRESIPEHLLLLPHYFLGGILSRPMKHSCHLSYISHGFLLVLC